jgi:small subunit ribosomal protein S2
VYEIEEQISDDLLLPQEILLSAGVHIGTRIKSKEIERFIYRVRPDGLYVLDIGQMDKRIRTTARFLSRMNLEEVCVASGKRYGINPVEQFCNVIGCKPYTGRFTSGAFTNPLYSDFFEPEAVIVTDSLADQQIVEEASQAGVPVIALCSTDNSIKNVDLVIPVNNKGRRSLAIVYWLLAREILREKGTLPISGDFGKTIEDFETAL